MPSGSIDDFEATHSLEEIKQLAVNKGVSPTGTKHEIVTHIRQKTWIFRFGKYKPIADEAVYHVSEAVRKQTAFDWSQVKGIFVGGCVKRGVGSSFRAKAHAHNFKIDPYFGWICVRSIKRIGETQGHTIIKPSALLWHEYAHILTPDHYHDDAWRAKMKELGQPITEQYRKKKRARIIYTLACQGCGYVWEGFYTEKCPRCGKGIIVMTPKRP